MKLVRRRGLAAACAIVATVLSFALVACGSDGDEGKGAATDPSDDFTIAFAMIGVPGEKFYNVIRNGADQAGRDLGVDVQYKETKQTDFQEQARLIESVAASKPDAMVVSDHEAETLNEPIKRAVDAGIPVMVIDAGIDEVEKVGALGFVGGFDEVATGRLVGQRMRAEGATNLICFNQGVGTPILDDRCKGIEEGFGGSVEVVGGDLKDRTATRNAIKAALQRLPEVDGIVGLGVDTGEEAARVVADSGKAGDIKVATYDLTPAILSAIEDGTVAFATDQQQWLFGWTAVAELAHLLRYDMLPSRVIHTGPGFVTRENAGDVIELSKRDIR